MSEGEPPPSQEGAAEARDPHTGHAVPPNRRDWQRSKGEAPCRDNLCLWQSWRGYCSANLGGNLGGRIALSHSLTRRGVRLDTALENNLIYNGYDSLTLRAQTSFEGCKCSKPTVLRTTVDCGDTHPLKRCTCASTCLDLPPNKAYHLL